MYRFFFSIYVFVVVGGGGGGLFFFKSLFKVQRGDCVFTGHFSDNWPQLGVGGVYRSFAAILEETLNWQ